MAEKPFDVAIVGAGQAGCTLAGKIAETGVRRLPGFMSFHSSTPFATTLASRTWCLG